MVAYQEWVSIVFDVSRQKGAVIASLNESQDVLGAAAALWSENPALKSMSRSQARSFAEEEIVVT